MVLLSIQGIVKNFGALRVLSDVHMNVEKGNLHSIVGPNGAGKTTLFNVISGFLRPTEGKIFFKDIDISEVLPARMANIGIRRSFQVIALFPELTVLENVRLAIQAGMGRNFSFFKRALKMADMVSKAYEILEILNLEGKAELKANELSHGEQRYLDIGITMAGGGELLLLDEPTSGLVYDEIPRMGETIKKLTPHMTILLIEHRIEMVLAISDIVTVLDYGRIIAQGPPDQIRRDDNVSKAYLGL